MTLLGLWLCGTAVLALTGFGFAVRELLLGRHRVVSRLALAFLGVASGIAAGVANPVINKAAFKQLADEYRAAMLDEVTRASPVGRTTTWLQQRYGIPREVRRDERGRSAEEQWCYAAAPWFVLEDDYVGFTVADGVVTGVRER